MKKTNTKVLGMFVVGGVAILVVGLLVFGGGQFFRTTQNHVIYFDEPLQGLSVGAPVMAQGVRIGSVKNIVIEFDTEKLTTRTPVYIEIDLTRLTWVGEGSPGGYMDTLIKRGMRAQIGLDSIVTGQRSISLVEAPDTEIVLVGDRNEDDEPGFEIPAIPSATSELRAGLETAVRKFADLDVEEIDAGVKNVLSGASRLLDNPEIAEVIHGANLTMPEIRRLLQNLSKEVDPVALSIKGASDQAQVTLVKAEDTLERVDAAVAAAQQTFEGAQGTLRRFDRVANDFDALIKPGSATHFEFVAMMREFTAAARSVRSLANTLERDPESVLFGRTRSAQ